MTTIYLFIVDANNALKLINNTLYSFTTSDTITDDFVDTHMELIQKQFYEVMEQNDLCEIKNCILKLIDDKYVLFINTKCYIRYAPDQIDPSLSEFIYKCIDTHNNIFFNSKYKKYKYKYIHLKKNKFSSLL